jgi:hypothetical protein
MSVFHSVSGKFSRRGQIGEGIGITIRLFSTPARRLLPSPGRFGFLSQHFVEIA